MEDYIGQDDIINDLYIHLNYASLYQQPMDHIMLYGQAGLGKTSLAKLIANHLASSLILKTGEELKHKIIEETITRLQYRDILFIDEIHNVPVKAFEYLYGPLQIINDMKLDRKISSFYFENLLINPFTLIGATTSAGMVPKPFRDRIVLTYHLKPYTEDELIIILINKGCPIRPAQEIAKRSRGIPRLALNYFIRLRNTGNFLIETCNKMFDRLKINSEGFTDIDILILKYLYNNGISSEHTICQSLSIDPYDYRNMYEPFLLEKGLIKISSKGRILTDSGKKQFEILV